QYIHAAWFGHKTFVRRVRKTKLSRPQSFQFVLSTHEEVPFKLSELNNLNAEMMGALFELFALHSFVMREEDGRAPSPSISFAQYLRAVRRNRPKYARRKRLPRHRSSRG